MLLVILFFKKFLFVFFPLPFIKHFQVVPAWGPLQWGVPGQADLQEPHSHLPDALEGGVLDSSGEMLHKTRSRIRLGFQISVAQGGLSAFIPIRGGSAGP